MHDPFQLSGQTLDGKYRLDAVIGEGGFGVVYAGRQIALDQPVAIKVLKPESGGGGAESASFLREARVLFQLSHPGIVRLYDVGEVQTAFGATPYVVLERLAGRTLEDEIAARQRERRPFTSHELLSLADGLLDALAFAHRCGVVHRDIKPANVMIVAGPQGAVPKILDFGLARGGAGAVAGPSTGAVGLTPRYAAPEQWNATYGAVGPATDLFALGLVLEEAATLVPALEGQSIPEVVAATMSTTRKSRVAERRPDLPPALDELVTRATRVSPHERFASADAMRDRVRTLVSPRSSGYGPFPSGHPTSAPPSPLATSAPLPTQAPGLHAGAPGPYGPPLGPSVTPTVPGHAGGGPLGRPAPLHGAIGAIGAPPHAALPSGPPPVPPAHAFATVPPFTPAVAPPGGPLLTTSGPIVAPLPHPHTPVHDAARGKGSNGAVIGGVLAVVLVAGTLAVLVVAGGAYAVYRYVESSATPDDAPPKPTSKAPATASAAEDIEPEPSAAPTTPSAPSVPSAKRAATGPSVAPGPSPSPTPSPAPSPSPSPAPSVAKYGWRILSYEGVSEADKPKVKAAVDRAAGSFAHCFEGPGLVGRPWNVTFTKPIMSTGRGFGSGVTRMGGQVYPFGQGGPSSTLRDCTDNILTMTPFPILPYIKVDGGKDKPPQVVFFAGSQ